MSKILLANIGNRNISYDGKDIDKKNMSFWDFTQMLWEGIKDEKSNITLNILPSILDQYEIEKIYFFATNQGHKQDTWYETKIIQYILEQNPKYKEKIVIEEIKHKPTDRVASFNFYKNFFEKHKEFAEKELVVCASGGVAAMKEALNFYTIVSYPNLIIADIDEETNEVNSSSIDQEYLKNIDKKTLQAMIERYNYDGAKVFLRKSRIQNKELRKILEYTNNRFNFDFESCTLENKKIPPLPSSREEKIFELLSNIEVSYFKGEYAMMVGKIFALREGLIKQLWEEFFGYDIELKENFAKVKSVGVEFENNKNGEYPRTWSIKKIIDDNRGNMEEKQKVLKKNLDLIGKYKDERNRSIMAHGFGGVSKTTANDFRKIVEELKKLYNIKGNIFDQINDYILDKI